MNKLKPYLPLAVRVVATVVAGVVVLKAVRWDISPEHVEEALGAAALAFTRWHPNASLKALFAYLGIKDDSDELPVDTPSA